jgi:uncharacterized Zn finger protein (UPF0148 family)
MKISSCPFCGKPFPQILHDGIIFCDKCNHMVESSLRNKLLSVFRSVEKYNGVSLSQIKYEAELDDQSWQLIIKSYEDCLSWQEFQELLNKMSLSSSSSSLS